MLVEHGAGKIARLAAALVLLAAATPAAAADDPRCRPLTLDEWRGRCVADRATIREALPDVRRARSFTEIGSAGEACRVLAAGAGQPECAQARAQLMALLLNVGAGRLTPACCVGMPNGQLITLVDLIRRADAALIDGMDPSQCPLMASALGQVNDGSMLVGCDGPAGAEAAQAPREPEARPEPSASVRHADPPSHLAAAAGGVTARPAADAADEAASDAGVAPGRCCDPRTLAAWARACRLRDRWAATVDTLDDATREEFGTTACDALQADDGSACAAARRELVALRVNIRTGRIAPRCALAQGGTVTDAFRHAVALRRAGDCASAADVARGVNSGAALAASVPCDPAGDSQDDVAWTEPPPPEVVPAADAAAAPEEPPADDRAGERRRGRRGRGPR